MDSKLTRRDFFKKSAVTGAACCAIIASSKVNAFEEITRMFDDKKIDPKKLNYCGYTCPANCEFKVATDKNDEKLKRLVYEKWKIKEKHNVEFDPKNIFCNGCKPTDKPLGVVINNCKNRKCAIEKKFDSCIECKEMSKCDKPLWKEFPDFYKAMLDLQKKYIAQSQKK